jgi:hypothetical protein
MNWIPAFAGMTDEEKINRGFRVNPKLRDGLRRPRRKSQDFFRMEVSLKIRKVLKRKITVAVTV